jgi:hypothetical protein
MLEPEHWNSALSSVTGTVYRGTERISSNALLNLLEVGPDPVFRQKVAKRNPRPSSKVFRELLALRSPGRVLTASAILQQQTAE